MHLAGCHSYPNLRFELLHIYLTPDCDVFSSEFEAILAAMISNAVNS
jgi:hypothetical protein